MNANSKTAWDQEPFRDRGTERYRPEPPNTQSLWVAFAVVLVALMGASAYGYYSLRENGIRLSQIPSVIDSVSALSERLSAAEARMSQLASDWNGLHADLTKLERKVNAGLSRNRKRAEELTAQLEARFQDRLERQYSSMDARLGQIESQQREERARLAQLRNELARVRGKIETVRQHNDEDFQILRDQVASTERELNALAEDLEPERVDFEVLRKRVHELAPGITLKVTGTNTRYQRYSAWIRYAPDGRTLWVRNQGVQQPVIFYSKRDGDMYELVVTGVTRDSAVGYLLIPASGGSLGPERAAVTRNGTTGQASPAS